MYTHGVDTTATDPPTDDDALILLTVAQAGEILTLHERTVRQWMADGRLPWVRLGDGKGAPVRIRKRDVLALIRPSSHGQQPQPAA